MQQGTAVSESHINRGFDSSLSIFDGVLGVFADLGSILAHEWSEVDLVDDFCLVNCGHF